MRRSQPVARQNEGLLADWGGRVPCLGASAGLCHPPGTDMHDDQLRRERMLNVPAVVVVLLGVLVLIHAGTVLLLTAQQTTEFLLLFAFIPARYDASVMPDV